MSNANDVWHKMTRWELTRSISGQKFLQISSTSEFRESKMYTWFYFPQVVFNETNWQIPNVIFWAGKYFALWRILLLLAGSTWKYSALSHPPFWSLQIFIKDVTDGYWRRNRGMSWSWQEFATPLHLLFPIAVYCPSSKLRLFPRKQQCGPPDPTSTSGAVHQCVRLPTHQYNCPELSCWPAVILTNFSLPAHFNSRKDSPTSTVSVALYHLQSALLNQNRKGWGRATRILTAFDGASSDLLLSGLALSGGGYFWQKPPVVKLRGCHCPG